jgi:hypothetical protein
MEFKQAIGLRRSIRYYQPYRPVERAKAIVVNRDYMAPEDRDVLKVPTTTAQLGVAPTWIFW